MNPKTHWQQMLQYQPESWRNDGASTSHGDQVNDRSREEGQFVRVRKHSHPDAREQTMVLELLGRVNYKIIQGSSVYIEVGGVVYKTLYGGYWRSVFTGIEHYLLRCEQVSGSIWADESCTGRPVDLPVAYSDDGWTASGYSLSFMLSRD
jgi:hypothetical protein